MTVYWTPLLLFIIMVDSAHCAARLPNVSADSQVASDYKQDAEQSSNKRTYLQEWPDDVQLGCKELRAKRFISDGFCTSLRPIKEVVCAGFCMPIKERNLPWWSEFTKYWARPKLREWRCVEAVVKLKRVQLMCENGETRTYKIKIVKSCRCKSYENEHNETVRPMKRTRSGNKKNKLTKAERRLRRKQRKEKRRQRREEKLKRKRRKSHEKQTKKLTSNDSISNGNSSQTV